MLRGDALIARANWWRLSNAGSFAADSVTDRELPCVFALSLVVTMRICRACLRADRGGNEPAGLAFGRVPLYKAQLKIVSNRLDKRCLVLGQAHLFNRVADCLASDKHAFT